MRVLLDTQILLWAVVNDPRLSDPQKEVIGAGELYLSAASVWDIGIKQSLGKLDVPDDLFDVVVASGCKPLPITWVHAEAASRLPMHHNNPFDRMLIAQARCEGLTLLTSNNKMQAYDVQVIG